MEILTAIDKAMTKSLRGFSIIRMNVYASPSIDINLEVVVRKVNKISHSNLMCTSKTVRQQHPGPYGTLNKSNEYTITFTITFRDSIPTVSILKADIYISHMLILNLPTLSDKHLF